VEGIAVMWKDPTFMDRCAAMCRKALSEAGRGFSEEEVQGNTEKYRVLRPEGAEEVQIFIYSDGAGIMGRGDKWRPYEAPDYKSGDELIARLGRDMAELLARGTGIDLSPNSGPAREIIPAKGRRAMSGRRRFLVFIAVWVVHMGLQLVAWSGAPGNTAGYDPMSEFYGLIWAILAFPLFTFLGEPLGTTYFEIALCVNSLIWALSLVVAYAWWIGRGDAESGKSR